MNCSNKHDLHFFISSWSTLYWFQLHTYYQPLLRRKYRSILGLGFWLVVKGRDVKSYGGRKMRDEKGDPLQDPQWGQNRSEVASRLPGFPASRLPGWSCGYFCVTLLFRGSAFCMHDRLCYGLWEMFQKKLSLKYWSGCFENWSDLQWENIVLVMEKNFWNFATKERQRSHCIVGPLKKFLISFPFNKCAMPRI